MWIILLSKKQLMIIIHRLTEVTFELYLNLLQWQSDCQLLRLSVFTRCHHIIILIPVFGQYWGIEGGSFDDQQDAWSNSHSVAVCLMGGSHTSLPRDQHDWGRQCLHHEHTGTTRIEEPFTWGKAILLRYIYFF